MSAARLLALLVLIGTVAQADDLRSRADRVPLPRAPSSLPSPPWALYGGVPSGWGAVGVVIADPGSWSPVPRHDHLRNEDRAPQMPCRDAVGPCDGRATPQAGW